MLKYIPTSKIRIGYYLSTYLYDVQVIVNFPAFLLVVGILTKSGIAYWLGGVRGEIWNYRVPSKPRVSEINLSKNCDM
jgi:hypothetical protein